MNQKTILLLGGSYQQLVAIRSAKALGYRTVLCDYLPDNPGQYEVDKFYQVSTTDVEAIYHVAKSEAVNGILAYASDPAALPAAIVCERLGLPTNPAKSVAVLGLKHKFREFLRDNNFACPRMFTFSPDADVEDLKEKLRTGLSFPIVVKPTDSSGSKGVTKIFGTSDLPAAIAHAEKYSRNNVIIAEEFIERGFPNVVGGDIFIEDGRIILFGEMACQRGNQGLSLIPIGKIKPSGLNALQSKRVHDELQRMVDMLGIKFGEMNIEILLDKYNNVHFLELGPRAGGNMIPIQLSDAFDVDLPKANVLVAMGEKSGLEPKEQDGCFCHYVVHSHKNGIYETIEYSPEIEPYIYRKCIYKHSGDKIEAFDGAGKAIGIVFLRFPDTTTMNEFYPKCGVHITPILMSSESDTPK